MMPSGHSSTSSFHSNRMLFLSAKLNTPYEDLPKASTFFITKSGIGHAVNLRHFIFLPVSRLKKL
jgi:hypothetical protein